MDVSGPAPAAPKDGNYFGGFDRTDRARAGTRPRDHAKVHIEVTASPYRRIQADIHRLGQVFHNIILNAIQAMPEGGKLSISISEAEICFSRHRTRFFADCA